MNLKNLNKKIRRLVTRIEKDTKKLAKLRFKLTKPPGKKQRSSKKEKTASARMPEAGSQAKASKSSRKPKAKRTMSATRRAELAAAMKARWAEKKAAAQTKLTSPDSSITSGAGTEVPDA
jgi:hypothetical protein